MLRPFTKELTPMNSMVTVTGGRVRGQVRDGVACYLGIPYAADPTGPLRFQAPAPPVPWAGVREAAGFGATPPKPRYREPFATLLYEPDDIPGNSWLTVNVWSPETNTGGLPVMVWIHGGAFGNGNSALPLYDGHAFARDGIVLVSINYRLGIEGFALIDGAVPNRGLLDQIAALEWVRDNVAAFGGDPGTVTVFGESAGAMSITTLMAMPRAEGLFHQAITQSGSVQAAATVEDAALVTRGLGKLLGIEMTSAHLADLEQDTYLGAQRELADALDDQPDPNRFGATIVAASMPFIPVIDGELLPAHPLTAIADGAGSDVTLLTGTNTEEHRLFLVPTGVAGAMTDEMLEELVAGPVCDVYRAARPDATPGDLLSAILTDSYFRLPAYAVAQARPAPTFVYEFAWPSPASDLGCCHALEIGFVFDNLHAEGNEELAGPNPPQELATLMHQTWITFARTGEPGWAAFDSNYPVMTFGEAGAELVNDPRSLERLAWSR
jgi:para-nitrobenzyl esterase